jgi:hypothetical protein
MTPAERQRRRRAGLAKPWQKATTTESDKAGQVRELYLALSDREQIYFRRWLRSQLKNAAAWDAFIASLSKPLKPGCCTFHDTGGSLDLSCGPCNMGGCRTPDPAVAEQPAEPDKVETAEAWPIQRVVWPTASGKADRRPITIDGDVVCKVETAERYPATLEPSPVIEEPATPADRREAWFEKLDQLRTGDGERVATTQTIDKLRKNRKRLGEMNDKLDRLTREVASGEAIKPMK